MSPPTTSKPCSPASVIPPSISAERAVQRAVDGFRMTLQVRADRLLGPALPMQLVHQFGPGLATLVRGRSVPRWRRGAARRQVRGSAVRGCRWRQLLRNRRPVIWSAAVRASVALRSKCQRSATCSASGAPSAIACAYASARSRVTISTPDARAANNSHSQCLRSGKSSTMCSRSWRSRGRHRAHLPLLPVGVFPIPPPHRACGWVGRQRVSPIGTFPTAPRRTTRDRFPYHVALQWSCS